MVLSTTFRVSTVSIFLFHPNIGTYARDFYTQAKRKKKIHPGVTQFTRRNFYLKSFKDQNLGFFYTLFGLVSFERSEAEIGNMYCPEWSVILQVQSIFTSPGLQASLA